MTRKTLIIATKKGHYYLLPKEEVSEWVRTWMAKFTSPLATRKMTPDKLLTRTFPTVQAAVKAADKAGFDAMTRQKLSQYVKKFQKE